MISREKINEIEKEIEMSNIRKSSNDDVEYATSIIDRLLALIEPEIPIKHSKDCPCVYCS